MSNWLWYIGKAFLVGFPFMAAMAILTLVIGIIGMAIARMHKRAEAVFLFVATIVFIYAWTFLGAFEAAHARNYSTLLDSKWICAGIAFAAMMTWLRPTRGELARQIGETQGTMNVSMRISHRMRTNTFDQDLFSALVRVIALRYAPIAIPFFLISLWFPKVSALLWGQLPLYLSRLWMN